MAAYAALVSLMNIIHDIQHHHSPPISIDIQQAQSLSQTIASLQLFLETHNTSSVFEIDEADPLEMRIADAAYAAEDIIESHIVNRILPENVPFSEDDYQINILFSEVASYHDDETNIPLSEVASHHDDETKLYEDLQRVIDEMESIKKQTVEIDAEKKVVHHHQRLRPVNDFAAPSKSHSGQNSITMCSDNVINEVMEKLTWGQSNRHVIPIVGMGGIGKTTLAKHIYEKPFIKEHFQIRAWATISQQYNVKEILCEVLCQATNTKKEVLSEKSEDKLGTELYQHLFGRRYLIVMDDMWTMDAWDRIQRLFHNNDNGSRVLVTTRLSQLSSQLNESYSHHMKFLDECSSWDLFSKTVFEEESCPGELEGIGKKIVENCRGLPLSIVVVGGILKKIEHTQGCWESIAKNLTSLVNLENNKHCLRLLSLSYSYLPVYLKPCFLYTGVFEEDSKIKVSTLIKQWIGEGFLKSINDESLEETGNGFLKDLVDRNLILVDELGSTGNIKYCKVHDLLRDFCLSEGKKDGFYHMIGQDSPRDMDMQRRRVVIPKDISREKVLEDLKSMSHVRYVISEDDEVPFFCKNFRFVRAYKCFVKLYVEYKACQYVNLRHLAVKVDSMSSFFSSITLLWNLHTLIVDCYSESTAPVEIWKMPQFRHIEFRQTRLLLPDPPRDSLVMENLHTLMGVENFKLGEEAIERIPNMKKLQMWYGGKGFEYENYYCLSNIERLCNLESLNVTVYLWRRIERVESLNKLTFPHSLKKLALHMIKKFEWEDMLEKVGSLPLLEKLDLSFGRGFRREEWEIAEGQFSCLKYLKISYFEDLRRMTAKDESSVIFPRLERLDLHGLDELEEIPYEIGEIATLQNISITDCNASVVKRAKEIVEEQMELKGDDLPFNVVVTLYWGSEHLVSLAGPNFKVVKL